MASFSDFFRLCLIQRKEGHWSLHPKPLVFVWFQFSGNWTFFWRGMGAYNLCFFLGEKIRITPNAQ